MKQNDYSTHGSLRLEELLGGNIYVTHASNYTNVALATVTLKRTKPSILTVKSGTERRLDFTRVTHKVPGRVLGPGYYKDYTAVSGIPISSPLTQTLNLLSDADLYSILQNKILAEINEQKSQLAVDLIELRKTKAMFADAAHSLLTGFRDIRRGVPLREFAKTIKKEGYSGLLGRKWLEFIYGWSPTVSGAFDTAEALNQELMAGIICTGKVRAKQQKNARLSYQNGLVDCNLTVRANGCYHYIIKNPDLLLMSQLGLTNPLSVAWELTPWSFVFDWFVDVGGYINRMDYNAGVYDFVWQGSTKKHAICDAYMSGINYNKLKVPAVSQYERVVYHRRRPTVNIVNSFRGLKIFTNETVRLTSAVALMNQQRMRIRRT